MATDANGDHMRQRLDFSAKERELILRGLRALWGLHINAQIGVAARFSGGDASLRGALEATDAQLAEIRALAARLGSGVL